MNRLQIIRVACVSWIVAAAQVAGFDRFLLFGAAHLVLPLFLVIAIGRRLPFTNAVIAGALIGGSWDLLGVDLFGRYALALAVAGGTSSLLLFGRRSSQSADSRRTRWSLRLRRFVATTIAAVALVVVSAAAGETLPATDSVALAGLVLSAAVGTVLSGRLLTRLALPGHIVWDPAPQRSTDWVDRRAGLYSVTTTVPEREAA